MEYLRCLLCPDEDRFMVPHDKVGTALMHIHLTDDHSDEMEDE